MMKTIYTLGLVLLAAALNSLAAQEKKSTTESLLNGLSNYASKPGTLKAADSVLSNSEVISGLKQALGNGVEKAVSSLAKPDGFLKNNEVKIPVPVQLQRVEQASRLAGQGKRVDEFVTTLNRAGEGAVSSVAPVLNEAIQAMTIEDATTIWKGAPDSATQYFRKVAEPKMIVKIRPIVTAATNKAGVANSYKNLTSRAAFVSPLLDKSQQSLLDLDGYITTKTMDGLFVMIAKEEANIRKNPTARTTELLRKMFKLQ